MESSRSRTDSYFVPRRVGKKTSDIGNFKYYGKKDWVRPKDFPMIIFTMLMISIPTFYFLLAM
jgi:hypothetical protein